MMGAEDMISYYWIVLASVTISALGTMLPLNRSSTFPKGNSTTPRYVMTAITALTAIAYIALGLFKLNALQMGLWDFGIYDSILHLAATGRPLLRDFRGGTFDHFSPLTLLMAPLYRLCDSPVWLVLIQSAAMAGAAPLLYMIARRYFHRPEPALTVSAMYLLNPYFSRIALYDFHIECLFPLFFFGAFLAWSFHRQKVFMLLLTAVPLIKEDFIVPLCAVGLYCLSMRGRRRTGMLLLCASILWTLFILQVYFPLIARSDYPHYSRYEISHDNIKLMAERLLAPHVPGVLLSVLLPFALLPIANWRGFLLMLMPVLGVQLVSSAPHQNLLISHYASALIGVTPIAALLGARTLRAVIHRAGLRSCVTHSRLWRFALLLTLTVHLLCCDLPLTRYYCYVTGWNPNMHPGLLSLPLRFDCYRIMHAASAHATEAKRILLEAIPEHLSVTAQNELGTLFVRHRKVYSVPGPPEGSDIYVFDQSNYYRFDAPDTMNSCLISLLRNPQYRLLFRHHGILIFARCSVIPRIKGKFISEED